ncbi:MAG: IS630 transposase-related protein [Pseudomonadota bacterium]
MAYSLDLRKRAVSLLDEGKNTKEIGELLGVSDRSVLYWKKRDEEGRLATHYPKSRGAYTIDDEALKEHLETHPDAYLEELAEASGGTPQGILHALKRLGLTRKKRPRSTEKEMKRNAKHI